MRGEIGQPPWQRSWLYIAPKGAATFWWLLLLHLSALVGIWFVPTPKWYVVAVSFSLLFLGGLGTTVCYHRALAHRALKIHPIVQHVLIFFAMFNGSGSPLLWVANHRLHHAHADEEGDVSSPRHGGFWWAHLRWLWQAPQASPQKYCRDLLGPEFAFWEKVRTPVTLVGFLCGAAFGADWWLWLGPLRMLWALHGQCAVNSICHLGRGAQGQDSSLNVPWLTVFHLGQGENWHANHHGAPRNVRLGLKLEQIDFGYMTIKLLLSLKLARRLVVS